jgi:hypothetical protein
LLALGKKNEIGIPKKKKINKGITGITGKEKVRLTLVDA